MLHSDYIYYLCGLLGVTGLLLIFLDGKMYKEDKMVREKQIAVLFGWINVSVSLGLFIVTWAYRHWFF